MWILQRSWVVGACCEGGGGGLRAGMWICSLDL